MDLSSAIVAQSDPAAIALWNRFADGELSVFADLQRLLEEDFPSFCALLLKVRPKGGGVLRPFVFNQVQRRMWREIVLRIEAQEPIWFIILKFRQAGMSTFWCAWLFWQMWRQKDIQEMVIAHQLLTAETMIETQRVFYDELPDMFKPELREGNHGASIPRGEIYFKDRRSWQMVHLSRNVDPRGQQVTHVLETELAMYHDPEELNGALFPQLPPFGSEARLRSSVVIESTPKGQNAFHDYYKDARAGRMKSFKAVFFPWFLFDDQYAAALPPKFKLSADEREEKKRLSRMRINDYPPADGGGVPVTDEQMYWRRETIASEYRGDVDRFDQEYPSDDESCWLLASKSVFRQFSRELMAMCDNAREHARAAWATSSLDGKKEVVANGPLRVRLHPKYDKHKNLTPIERHVDFSIHPHGSWLVWEPPAAGHKYCIGGDPSMGVGADASVISVIDVTEGRQVAEFADNTMGPEDFAIEMAAAGYWYNGALLVPEIVSIGYTVLVRLLKNIAYPYMYRWPRWDEVNKYTHKRGYETNHRTKQLMVSTMMHAFENDVITIASRELLSELSTFEQKNQEGIYIVFEAAKNRHDDRVMAFGLACMGIEQTPILHTEVNRKKSRLPTATELHLAGSMDRPHVPLPKKIEDLITVKSTIPWNPMQEAFLS